MSRIATFALAAALTVAASPAFAGEGHGRAEHHAEADKKFPMPAAEYQQHVAARQEKARARMEEHIAKEKLAEDKANEIRARFAAGIVKINEKVAAVCADGTVTLEEAKEVRAVVKAVHPHHGHKPQGTPALPDARSRARSVASAARSEGAGGSAHLQHTVRGALRSSVAFAGPIALHFRFVIVAEYW